MRRTDIEQVVSEELLQIHGKVGKPYVDVTLIGPCKGKRCPTVSGKMLVDTGARNAFIDPSAVKKLKLKSMGRGKVKGIVGRGQVLDKYPVRMTFPGTDLPDIPLLKKGAYRRKMGRLASIGVDALSGGDGKSSMRLEFDAAAGKIELHPSRPKKSRKKAER